MKFEIDGKVLKEAGALIGQAIDQKSDVPDHSYVYLETGALALRMCGFNGRYMVETLVIPPTNPEPGTVLINAKMWQQLLSASSGKAVHFESDGQKTAKVYLVGQSGKANTFDLNAMPAKDYTGLSLPAGSIECYVDRWQLKDALRVVRPTADSGNANEIVNGVCFEFGTENVRLIATDIAVMGYAEMDATFDASGGFAAKVSRTIPKEAVDILDKMITSCEDDKVTITVGDALVSFKVGQITLVSSLLAGGTDYINYQRQVPDAIDGPMFSSTAGEIISAMNLAEIVEGGQPVSVDVNIATDAVEINSEGFSGSHSGELVANSISGNIVIRLDSKLAKNAMRGLESATPVQFATVSDGKRVQVFPTMPNLNGVSFQVWGAKTRKKVVNGL